MINEILTVQVPAFLPAIGQHITLRDSLDRIDGVKLSGKAGAISARSIRRVQRKIALKAARKRGYQV